MCGSGWLGEPLLGIGPAGISGNSVSLCGSSIAGCLRQLLPRPRLADYPPRSRAVRMARAKHLSLSRRELRRADPARYHRSPGADAAAAVPVQAPMLVSSEPSPRADAAGLRPAAEAYLSRLRCDVRRVLASVRLRRLAARSMPPCTFICQTWASGSRPRVQFPPIATPPPSRWPPSRSTTTRSPQLPQPS